MSKSIPFRKLLTPNPIFWNYVENFDRVEKFYAVDYRQPVKRWEIIENTVNKTKVDLIEGLLDDARQRNYSSKTSRNIEALGNPETLVVVTGQQVGLFGGPLYTYYKAISAVLWAREIEKQTGRPTVPVFWMETSDHDFFEINYLRILDPDGEEVTLSLTNPPKEKRRVVGSITFNGEIEQLVHRLWNLLPSNAYRGPLLEKLGSIYHPGETVGTAFAHFFSSLFVDDGLVLFDAENARCKKAVAPLLDRILESSQALNLLLDDSTKAVERAGYPPQIHPQEDRLQLFAKTGDVRVPLDQDGTLLFDEKPDEKAGIEELRLRAAEAPEQFLPKVSLRPIMQDFLFPTVAYIAGPSEIAYFAQLKPLYEQLDVAMPAIVPRLSLTLIEAKIKKILDKFNLTPEQLQDGPQGLIQEYLEDDPGNDLVGLFAKARKKWEELGEDLTLGLLRIDPTLQQPLEKSITRWQQGLNVLEEKARGALSRKNETEVNQIKKCCTHLMPGGNLQERRFNLLYYLVRYGQELGRQIRAQAQIDLFRHQLIHLNHND